MSTSSSSRNNFNNRIDGECGIDVSGAQGYAVNTTDLYAWEEM